MHFTQNFRDNLKNVKTTILKYISYHGIITEIIIPQGVMHHLMSSLSLDCMAKHVSTKSKIDVVQQVAVGTLYTEINKAT